MADAAVLGRAVSKSKRVMGIELCILVLSSLGANDMTMLIESCAGLLVCYS